MTVKWPPGYICQRTKNNTHTSAHTETDGQMQLLEVVDLEEDMIWVLNDLSMKTLKLWIFFEIPSK